jgi:hypothetical protein
MESGGGCPAPKVVVMTLLAHGYGENPPRSRWSPPARSQRLFSELNRSPFYEGCRTMQGTSRARLLLADHAVGR